MTEKEELVALIEQMNEEQFARFIDRARLVLQQQLTHAPVLGSFAVPEQ